MINRGAARIWEPKSFLYATQTKLTDPLVSLKNDLPIHCFNNKYLSLACAPQYLYRH
jgi:hypothetical protein